MPDEKQVESESDSIKLDTQCSVELDKTFEHVIENVSFGELSQEVVNETFKDGRPFSHFIERWLEAEYPIDHIAGCKNYDFVDRNNKNVKYDEKTFTQGGCKYCPSSMIGTGRIFNKEEFEEKTKKLIFCIVSNIHFPRIRVRFVRGITLLEKYPKGVIPLKDADKFFN